MNIKTNIALALTAIILTAPATAQAFSGVGLGGTAPTSHHHHKASKESPYCHAGGNRSCQQHPGSVEECRFAPGVPTKGPAEQRKCEEEDPNHNYGGDHEG